MLRIWGRKSSSNVQALMWGVGELGLPHVRIDAGFTYGVIHTPEYLAMNPNGTVPTLVDGDGPPIWESAAILRYLASHYGTGTFWPADPAARAQVDMWAEWAKLNVAQTFTGSVFWRLVRTPAAQRDPAAIAQGLKTLDRFLAIADTHLAGRSHLAGDAFTLADIQFGHCLFRYYDLDIDRPPHAHLRRYYEGLTGRPAFREHVMVSYDELRSP